MKVKFSIGRTYNLGNYQSLRVDIGAEGDDYDTLKAWALEKLREFEQEHLGREVT